MHVFYLTDFPEVLYSLVFLVFVLFPAYRDATVAGRSQGCQKLQSSFVTPHLMLSSNINTLESEGAEKKWKVVATVDRWRSIHIHGICFHINAMVTHCSPFKYMAYIM